MFCQFHHQSLNRLKLDFIEREVNFFSAVVGNSWADDKNNQKAIFCELKKYL